MNIKLLFILIFMMMSVGFYMLLERKILGYMNNRKGPNKVLLMGLFQFLIDMIKLLFKENIMLFLFNKFNYLIFIMILFLLSFILWMLIPFMIGIMNFNFMMLLIMMILINKILIFINLIWVTYSIYSLISIIRLIIQNFSYEILIMLIFFFLMFVNKSMNLVFYIYMYKLTYLFMFSFLIYYYWILSLLIELNRVPFDYFESESELLSGYNIEFSSLNFMILFLIEYLDMIYSMILTVNVFFFLNLMDLLNYFILILNLMIYLFIRGFLIRYRIDKMFKILWKIIFPMMMNFLLLMLIIMMI